MSELAIGFMGLAVLVLLIAMGMRIAFAVTLVGAGGMIVLRGWGPATSFVGYLPSSLVGTYAYSVIPLFILMGYFAFHSGMTDELYSTARTWIQQLPGGIPMATILAGAGFAAVSGSSTAAASVLGKIAIPQMKDMGIDQKLAAGVVATAGTLASVIPPSALIVIYGILTEQSIAGMLMAGILPGALTALVYMLIIYVQVRMNPDRAPISPSFSWGKRIRSLKGVWGVLLLMLFVLGGIYTGVFTPTEAGGVGAFGAFGIALLRGRINLQNMKESLVETARTTTMIFAIMVGIAIFIRFLAFSGVSDRIGRFVVNLPVQPLYILLAMLVVYFVLGMFMDALSMMMLTLPIFFPAAVSLGYHPIWFGIIVVKMCEAALVSPPVGLNCYVVQSVAPDVPLEDVFRGVLPYIIGDFIVIAILIAFPQIALLIPQTMAG